MEQPLTQQYKVKAQIVIDVECLFDGFSEDQAAESFGTFIDKHLSEDIDTTFLSIFGFLAKAYESETCGERIFFGLQPVKITSVEPPPYEFETLENRIPQMQAD